MSILRPLLKGPFKWTTTTTAKSHIVDSTTTTTTNSNALISIKSQLEFALIKGQVLLRHLIKGSSGAKQLEVDSSKWIVIERNGVTGQYNRRIKMSTSSSSGAESNVITFKASPLKSQPNFKPNNSRLHRRASINSSLVSSSGSAGASASAASAGGANRAWTSLVGRLVSKWVSNSIAADLRRNASRQALFRGAGGYGLSFGLVGVSMNNGHGVELLCEADKAEVHCQEIRSLFSAYLVNYESRLMSPEAQTRVVASAADIRLSNLSFGSAIGKGCNAAVYSASLNDNVGQEFAVKMMFNYDAESNAAAIFKSMNKECITFNGHFPEDLDQVIGSRRTVVKPHPNVIEVIGVFADLMPHLPDAQRLYPNALPSRLYENGYGRNMTLFIVMPKYQMSLKQYLSENSLKPKTSLLLFTQLLEGIGHLVKNNVAHRDLKSDNILIHLSYGQNYPWLVITDFGFCSTTLHLPLTCDEVTRGGNRALMAPEVITAVPGAFSYIDYSSSDLWSAGSIAFEMFNEVNPFYKVVNGRKPIESRNYEDKDLPECPISMPKAIRRLVKEILSRNPKERPDSKVASFVCYIQLFASNRRLLSLKSLLNGPELTKYEKFINWLGLLSTSTLCHRKSIMNGTRLNEAELKLRLMFLSQVNISQLSSALNYFA